MGAGRRIPYWQGTRIRYPMFQPASARMPRAARSTLWRGARAALAHSPTRSHQSRRCLIVRAPQTLG
jgi:hypothetical protein